MKKNILILFFIMFMSIGFVAAIDISPYEFVNEGNFDVSNMPQFDFGNCTQAYDGNLETYCDISTGSNDRTGYVYFYFNATDSHYNVNLTMLWTPFAVNSADDGEGGCTTPTYTHPWNVSLYNVNTDSYDLINIVSGTSYDLSSDYVSSNGSIVVRVYTEEFDPTMRFASGCTNTPLTSLYDVVVGYNDVAPDNNAPSCNVTINDVIFENGMIINTENNTILFSCNDNQSGMQNMVFDLQAPGSVSIFTSAASGVTELLNYANNLVNGTTEYHTEYNTK